MSEKAPKPKLKSAIVIAFPAICICAVLIDIGVSPLWAAQPGVVPEAGELSSDITVEVGRNNHSLPKTIFLERKRILSDLGE